MKIFKLSLNLLAFVMVLYLAGCDEPELEVGTLYPAPWVVPQLTIRNVDSRAIAVQSVIVNGKYEVTHLWSFGTPQEYPHDPMETGRGMVLRLDPNWPRAINVQIKTDRGTVERTFKYSE